MNSAVTSSTALSNFRFKLGDLSQASFSEVISQFDAYKKELTDEYTKMVQQQYVLQGELVAALFQKQYVLCWNVLEYKRRVRHYHKV